MISAAPASTGMAALHVPQDTIDRVLNHAKGTLAGTYNRHQYAEEKRRALEAWAERVAFIVGEARDAVNVVELRATRKLRIATDRARPDTGRHRTGLPPRPSCGAPCEARCTEHPIPRSRSGPAACGRRAPIRVSRALYAIRALKSFSPVGTCRCCDAQRRLGDDA